MIRFNVGILIACMQRSLGLQYSSFTNLDSHWSVVHEVVRKVRMVEVTAHLRRVTVVKALWLPSRLIIKLLSIFLQLFKPYLIILRLFTNVASQICGQQDEESLRLCAIAFTVYAIWMEHVYKVRAISNHFFLNLLCIISHAFCVSSVFWVLTYSRKCAYDYSFLGDNSLETYMD